MLAAASGGLAQRACRFPRGLGLDGSDDSVANRAGIQKVPVRIVEVQTCHCPAEFVLGKPKTKSSLRMLPSARRLVGRLKYDWKLRQKQPF